MSNKVYEETHSVWCKWAAEYLHREWVDKGMPARVFQQFMWDAERCESPIERKMLAALLFVGFGYYDDINRICTTEEIEGGVTFEDDSAVIVPQARLKGLPYRVDFLVILNTRDVKPTELPPMFVVECDGHDFHERTKQQAARDRRRDRDIQALGLPILRFTGSEIHNDLDDCIDQIDQFGMGLLGKVWEGLV